MQLSKRARSLCSFLLSKRWSIVGLLWLLLAFGSTASAFSQQDVQALLEIITNGGEFELSNRALKDGPRWDNKKAGYSQERREQLALVRRMRARCEQENLGCKIVEVKGKWDTDYQVVYPDGWYFQISYDPYCVEITFKPSTAKELTDRIGLINDHIFKTGEQEGLTVIKPDNSHFNFGINSAFKGNAEHFLRFFVDYSNRPDLALGSLGMSRFNAPPLSSLDLFQRQALQKIVDAFYRGYAPRVSDVVRLIQDRVYIKTLSPKLGATHSQAIGLKKAYAADLSQEDAPVEMRAMWIQDSAENFILIAKLFAHRIAWLKTRTERIHYVASDRTQFEPHELKARFFIYLAEMNASFEEYQSLLPQQVRDAEWDAFVSRNATFEQKVESLGRYWDMLEISEWARDRIVSILSDPQAQTNALAQQWRTKLHGEQPSLFGQWIKKARTWVRGPHHVEVIRAGVLDQIRACEAGLMGQDLAVSY